MQKGRMGRAVAFSLALHAPVTAGFIYHESKTVQAAFSYLKGKYDEYQVSKKAEARKEWLIEERRRLKHEAREGLIGLGQFILRANNLDDMEKGGYDVENASRIYNEKLDRLNSLLRSGWTIKQAIPEVFQDWNYHRGSETKMINALLEKGGPCETIAHAVAAIAQDAGYEMHFRVYDKHLAPILVVEGEEYDLAAGEKAQMNGIRFKAKDLIEMYDTIGGGFNYPVTDDPYYGFVPLFAERAIRPPKNMRPSEDISRNKRQMIISGELDTSELPKTSGVPDFSDVIGESIELYSNGAAFSVSIESYVHFPRFNQPVQFDCQECLERDMHELSDTIEHSKEVLNNSKELHVRLYRLAVLVGLYNRVEFNATLVGKYRLAASARELKDKAYEEGTEILKGLKPEEADEVAKSFNKNDKMSYLKKMSYLTLLGEDGTKMLLKWVEHTANELRGDPNLGEADRRTSLSNLISNIPDKANEIVGVVEGYPPEFQFWLFSWAGHIDDCEKDLCKALDAYYRLEGRYEDPDEVVSGRQYAQWNFDFDQFRRVVESNLRKAELGNEWEYPMILRFRSSGFYRTANSACAGAPGTPDAYECPPENKDIFIEFKRDFQAYLAEHKD